MGGGGGGGGGVAAIVVGSGVLLLATAALVLCGTLHAPSFVMRGTRLACLCPHTVLGEIIYNK